MNNINYQINLIEKHLLGLLNEEEAKKLQELINKSPEILDKINQYKLLIEGIKIYGLKEDIKRSYKKYKSLKSLKKWFIISTIVITATIGSYFAYSYFKTTQNSQINNLPELNENNEALWAEADKYLPGQFYSINNEKDTVIESEEGIVFSIPANCFLDDNGNPVKGNIDVEVKEALNPLSMVKGGLTTMSGDELLESGGMFYLNARQNGKNLKIDPNIGVHTQVPTNKAKDGMMLYQGKRQANGSIDWVDPKPLEEKFLIPLDITALNFYPPEYLDSLNTWGYDVTNKIFTDSLYYSFASEFGRRDKTVEPAFPEFTLKKAKPDSVETILSRFPEEIEIIEVSDTTSIPSLLETITASESADILGINPAKIKAIWNKKFNNTILATKEFEERLKFIHRTCNESVLELYINNLTKRLSTIDSMAATLVSDDLRDQFLAFAKRNDGRIQTSNLHAINLTKYYNKKQKLYTRLIAEKQNRFWNKQSEQDIESNNKLSESKRKEVEMKNRVSDEELNFNIRKTYNELYRKINSYNATLRTTGWKNCDRPSNLSVTEVQKAQKEYIDSYNEITKSTTKRTSSEIKLSGQTAKIEYNPVSINLENNNNYDRKLVYLIPDKLNSFMRIHETEGKYDEKLNAAIKYDLIVLAYDGDKSYYKSIENISPKDYHIKLVETSESDIKNSLYSISNRTQRQELKNIVEYQIYERKDEKRRQKNKEKTEPKNRIRPVIFPCGISFPVSKTIIVENHSIPGNYEENEIYQNELNETIGNEPFAFFQVEEKPEFPGGETELMKWIVKTTKYPDKAKEKGIRGKVYVEFVIDKQGKITKVKLKKGVDPYLDAEALRVVKSMPKWEPGKQDGKDVPVKYMIPIKFALYE